MGPVGKFMDCTNFYAPLSKEGFSCQTEEILERLGVIVGDIGAKVDLNRSVLLDEKYDIEYYTLINGSKFFREGCTHYVRTEYDHIFVIRKLDDRNVSIDEKFIEDLKRANNSVSYVEINGIDVNVTSDSDKYWVDELTEMFKRCVKIEEEKDKNGIIEEVENSKKKILKSKKQKKRTWCKKQKRIRGIKANRSDGKKFQKAEKVENKMLNSSEDEEGSEDDYISILDDLESIETVKSKYENNETEI